VVANANIRAVLKGKERGLVVPVPHSSFTGFPNGRDPLAEIDEAMGRTGGRIQE